MIVPESAVPWIKLHRTHIDLDGYLADLESDFEDLKPYLSGAKTVLDIGCGMCGIDVLLAKRLGCSLLLLDSDGPIEAARGGFKKRMAPFMSRSAAEELLSVNGVTGYRWLDVGTDSVLKADAAISLLSMGWHYHADTYNVDAPVLIMDIRTKTDGFERVKRPFRLIRRSIKGVRVAFL